MASGSGTTDAFVLRTLVHYLDVQSWEEVEKLVQPTVDFNGMNVSATEFFAQLSKVADPGTRLERILDSILLDTSCTAVAARYIHDIRPVESTEGYQFQEIIFAWFTDHRLAKWQSLRDEDGLRARLSSVPRTPHQSFTGRLPHPSPSFNLKEHYRAYINSINEKTMDAEFERFCQPVLEHSGRQLSISEYIPLIRDSQDAIEGLHFHVQELLADSNSQQIAARLEFTGTPVIEWGGVKPNGKSIKFHEHVMYQLHEGKIARVWSVIELDMYRRQMQ